MSYQCELNKQRFIIDGVETGYCTVLSGNVVLYPWTPRQIRQKLSGNRKTRKQTRKGTLSRKVKKT